MLFVSRKALGTVLMLLFRLYEKVTKKYPRGLRPSGLRGTVQNSERGDYLLNRKLCAYQEIFIENCRFVQYSSEYFEPVRKGNFTAQGFVSIFEKARFDLGRQ